MSRAAEAEARLAADPGRHEWWSAKLVVSTERHGGCLIWTSAKMWKGYGVTDYDGVQLRVHRVALAVATGTPLPPGEVDHRCHTPACPSGICIHRTCVEPDHLKAGVSNRVNSRRRSDGVTPPTVRDLPAQFGTTCPRCRSTDLVATLGTLTATPCVYCLPCRAIHQRAGVAEHDSDYVRQADWPTGLRDALRTAAGLMG